MNKLIAIIDDEKDIVELLSLQLKKNNFNTIEFFDGISFLKSIKNNKPALIILDLMLPDMDGIEICKQIKSQDEYKKNSNNYAYSQAG